MEVYLNSIDGISDAMTSLYISKRSITREKQNALIELCDSYLDRHGKPYNNISPEIYEAFNKELDKVCKYGKSHTTLLRFIDLSFMVYGMHRGGQDDWDAHTQRYNNRIVRSSTRLASYEDHEMSDYYKGKILTTDQVLEFMKQPMPDVVEIFGNTYVKGVNGYIKEGYQHDNDVKRGLYMLSIPSNFIFRVNLCEWAHVYKERNINGSANPEVKQLTEMIADTLEKTIPQFNRELFDSIKN